jgi:hypothetical protein
MQAQRYTITYICYTACLIPDYHGSEDRDLIKIRNQTVGILLDYVIRKLNTAKYFVRVS